MRGFKSSGHAQRLLSSHGTINNLFRRDRHLMSARTFRELRERAFAMWNGVTGVVPAMCG